MAFRIQHPDSGLFWNSTNTAGSIILVDAAEATVYEVEQPNYIRNVATGMCLRHYSYVMREDAHGGPEYDFEYDIKSDGTILNPFDGGHFVGFENGVVRIVKDGAVKWVIVKDGEAAPAPVPVVEAAPAPEPVVEAAPAFWFGSALSCAAAKAAPAPEPVVEAAPEPVVEEPEVDDVPDLVTDDEEDVPVARSAALIEEALNAKAVEEEEEA